MTEPLPVVYRRVLQVARSPCSRPATAAIQVLVPDPRTVNAQRRSARH